MSESIGIDSLLGSETMPNPYSTELAITLCRNEQDRPDVARARRRWKEDLNAALTCLAERFPQTFVLEGYRPHRPLKVGIAADLVTRCPELDRRVLSAALSAYARRVMYLKGMVAGAARVDLDGNPVGEVSAKDEEHAAAKLAEILAAREARRAAAVAEWKQAEASAAAAASSAERKAKQPATPAAVAAEQATRQPAIPAAAAPPAAKALRDRPVLRLPAFRSAAQ